MKFFAISILAFLFVSQNSWASCQSQSATDEQYADCICHQNNKKKADIQKCLREMLPKKAKPVTKTISVKGERAVELANALEALGASFSNVGGVKRVGINALNCEASLDDNDENKLDPKSTNCKFKNSVAMKSDVHTKKSFNFLTELQKNADATKAIRSLAPTGDVYYRAQQMNCQVPANAGAAECSLQYQAN